MTNEVISHRIKEEKIDLGVISVEYREREEKDLREKGYFEPIQVKFRQLFGSLPNLILGTLPRTDFQIEPN